MNRIILFTIVILTISSLTAGNIYWNKQKNNTVSKARLVIKAHASEVSQTEEQTASNENKKPEDESLKKESKKAIASTKTEKSVEKEKADENETETATETKNNEAEKETANSNTDQNKESVKKEAATTSKPEKKPLSEIKGYYQTLFNDLETQESSKADQLIVQGKADQVSGEYNKPKLILKYQNLSKQLEQEADKKFNVLYESLQSDLDKHNYSFNEAQEYKTAYNSKKKARSERVLKNLY